MLHAVKAVFDGEKIVLNGPAPVKGSYEVVITFLEPVSGKAPLPQVKLSSAAAKPAAASASAPVPAPAKPSARASSGGIKWTPELSVKVKKFDDEHKKLIQLINDLYSAMKAGKAGDVMHKVLRDLVNYTKTHFSGEELLMHSYSYTRLDEQKKQHALFVKKIEDLQAEQAKGGIMTSISAANFIIDWIKNHIMKEDKLYSDFFNKKGVV